MRKVLWTLAATVVVAASVIGAKAHAFYAAEPIAVGTAAPAFTLPSQTDSAVSLKDYKGKFVVLYFYPKDQTSGCSLEAHNFERDTAKYKALNAVVLGVSFDTVESHKAFCTKDSLTLKLLADPKGKVVAEYGVPTMETPMGTLAKRDTFLISPEGKVLKFWSVKDVQGHSDEVLATIAEMKK